MSDTNNLIRVAILEDDVELQALYKQELDQCVDIQLVGAATNLHSATTTFASLQPDVIIVDLVLPDDANHNVVAELSALNPTAQLLVVSAHEDYDKIYRAILSGAVGYISKLSVQPLLADSIRQVNAGQSPISSSIARKVITAFQASFTLHNTPDNLTKRELEVLHLISSGRSYHDCADALFLSVETIRTHIRNAYKKLQIKSRKEIQKALRK